MERKAIEAVCLALEKHQGQVDKSGEPYILHIARVAFRTYSIYKDEDLLVAAILHDIIEDTPTTIEDLESKGFTRRSIDAVDSLTRRSREPYEDYIDRVGLNIDAIRIKLIDLTDNLDKERLGKLPKETANRLRKKYKKAENILSYKLLEFAYVSLVHER